MTPEGKVKVLIDRQIENLKDMGHPIYKHKPVMNGMGAPTLDYIGCAWGRYFSIEAKAPGKKPTPIQEKTMHEIEAAHGTCFVVDGEESLRKFTDWVIDVATGGLK